jgi:hypothetical protein
MSECKPLVVGLFCNTSPSCISMRHRPPGREGHKPILTHGLGVRGQVDLSDYQSGA